MWFIYLFVFETVEFRIINFCDQEMSYLFSVSYWTGRKSNLCHYCASFPSCQSSKFAQNMRHSQDGPLWSPLMCSLFKSVKSLWSSWPCSFYDDLIVDISDEALLHKEEVAGGRLLILLPEEVKPFLSSQLLFHYPHNIIPSRNSQFLENEVKKKIFGLLEQKSPKGIALFLEGNWRQKSNLRIKHDLISQRIIPPHCVLHLFFLYILFGFLSLIKTDDTF